MWGGAGRAVRLRCLVTVMVVLVTAGCEQAGPQPPGSVGPAREVRPADVQDPAAAPSASPESATCGDPRASLRPDGPPAEPGRMPPGSTMDAIVRRP
ncbi:hypothetical protein JOF56_001118 [Kibdelosporangium banguiense]|uniref:Lipoprotein n=1 Tax=Kibdelosporangium banguiense TaxID=1365924 RepID=A0ABS4T8H5_9PSEU|nr:hypothetical protein [Kibdelosporangium banguiense]MBP2320733.1 hypothetical protein [Kibdelosporangium banguiense]